MFSFDFYLKVFAVREHFPEGHSPIDFYLYDKVEICTGHASRTYKREDYGSLGLYHYDNRDAARFKVDYCVLRRGHVVSLCIGPEYSQDIGVLVTVLHHDEDIFLAYQRPETTVCENVPLLFFKCFKMTKSLNEKILFLVPVQFFVKRMYVYPSDLHWNELIL